MLYAKYNLATAEPEMLRKVIKDCPYGILHLRTGDGSSKTGVLVELLYSEASGLFFRIAHSYKVHVEELCSGEVSLKLCNKEKNIYLVADVTISAVRRNGFLSRAYLKGAVTRFNLFKKNKSDQLIALNTAV